MVAEMTVREIIDLHDRNLIGGNEARRLLGMDCGEPIMQTFKPGKVTHHADGSVEVEAIETTGDSRAESLLGQVNTMMKAIEIEMLAGRGSGPTAKVFFDTLKMFWGDLAERVLPPTSAA